MAMVPTDTQSQNFEGNERLYTRPSTPANILYNFRSARAISGPLMGEPFVYRCLLPVAYGSIVRLQFTQS